MTVPLAELLLTKLQIVRAEREGLSDAAWPCCTTMTSATSDADVVNAGLRGPRCAPSDWGLWRTLTANLDRCDAAVGRGSRLRLLGERRHWCTRRIARLRSRVEAEPKSRAMAGCATRTRRRASAGTSCPRKSIDPRGRRLLTPGRCGRTSLNAAMFDCEQALSRRDRSMIPARARRAAAGHVQGHGRRPRGARAVCSLRRRPRPTSSPPPIASTRGASSPRVRGRTTSGRRGRYRRPASTRAARWAASGRRPLKLLDGIWFWAWTARGSGRRRSSTSGHGYVKMSLPGKLGADREAHRLRARGSPRSCSSACRFTASGAEQTFDPGRCRRTRSSCPSYPWGETTADGQPFNQTTFNLPDQAAASADENGAPCSPRTGTPPPPAAGRAPLGRRSSARRRRRPGPPGADRPRLPRPAAGPARARHLPGLGPEHARPARPLRRHRVRPRRGRPAELPRRRPGRR